MKWTPEQIRNLSFDQVKAHVDGDRERCWTSLMLGGPMTTRQLAARIEIDLLTVRPRVSELVDLGFVVCTGKDGHEGIYQAVPVCEAQAAHSRRQRGEAEQLLLL